MVVVEHFALVQPNFHADPAIRGVGLGKTIINVRADGLQRDGAVVVLFAAGDLGAAQTAANLDLDALGAQAHGAADAALHGAAEGDPALQLGGHVFSHQLSVHVRLPHFYDVDDHGFPQHLLALLAQLLNFSAALADDHAGLRAMDVDAHLRGVALDFNFRDASGIQLLLQRLAEVVILHQDVAELTVASKPPGIPVFDNTHTETVGIHFLTHIFASLPLTLFPSPQW